MEWPTQITKARYVHTEREQNKPRPTCVKSISHHVSDLLEMGDDEAEALGTLDKAMGITTDARWSTRSGTLN